MKAHHQHKGLRAEEEFELLLKPYGTIIKANDDQDKFEHWDLALTPHNSGITYLYDVKSQSNYENYIWLELVNVQGDLGSLYGKADYFAFQTEQEFIIRERRKLLEYALHYRSKDVITKYKATPMIAFQVYQRPSTKEEIVYFPLPLIKFDCKRIKRVHHL
jgi:hypothetical protein